MPRSLLAHIACFQWLLVYLGRPGEMAEAPRHGPRWRANSWPSFWPIGTCEPCFRTLFRRRHAGSGLGIDEELVAKDGSSDPPSPGRNGERHFHGEQRSNETHGSTTDPETKLAKKGKGKEAKLAYTGSVMTENRNGSAVEVELRQMSGHGRARNRERHDRALFAGRQAHHPGRR
jgi:hypothetical protein